MNLNISKEELESMNYDDIAYLILSKTSNPLKINELFSQTCKLLGDKEEDVADKIVDFFELLTTDKRFIMLEDGAWDLRERHNPKVVVDDEDEEDALLSEEEDEENMDSEENEEDDIFYDADSDDDIPDDELEDLVVIDEDEEEANS